MISERRVSSLGASLAVQDHGGDGDVVVLVHGGPGVPRYLGPVADRLRDRGLHPVTFDQRGTGATTVTTGGYSPAEHAADVDAVRSAFERDRIHVFGHSWGGTLAQVYLAIHPDRVASLFLVSPAPGLGREWDVTGSEVLAFNKRRSSGLGWAAMGIGALGSRLPIVADASTRMLMSRVWRNYFADPRHAAPPDAEVLRGVRAEGWIATGKAVHEADAALLDGIGDVDVPVLVEFGADDIYVTAADILRRRFPNARHELLLNAGHLPWLQDPTAFDELLASFYG